MTRCHTHKLLHIANRALAVKKIQFILNLHAEYGSSSAYLKWFQNRQNVIIPCSNPLQKLFVVLSDRNAVCSQPCRKSASIPFRTNIWTRPCNHKKPMYLCQFQKSIYITIF